MIGDDSGHGARVTTYKELIVFNSLSLHQTQSTVFSTKALKKHKKITLATFTLLITFSLRYYKNQTELSHHQHAIRKPCHTLLGCHRQRRRC